MAKKFFKKKNKVKKGSDLPLGTYRRKGLGRGIFPVLRSPVNTKEAQRLVNISNRVVEDPSILAMHMLSDDDLDEKLDEIIPDEDE